MFIFQCRLYSGDFFSISRFTRDVNIRLIFNLILMSKAVFLTARFNLTNILYKVNTLFSSVAVKYLWEVFLKGRKPSLVFIAIPIFRLHYTHTKHDEYQRCYCTGIRRLDIEPPRA